jgi:hypothetical protein
MGVPNRLNSVPRRMLPIYKKVVDAIDEVCGRYLNQEYHDLARTMTQALCRKRPSPLTSGHPRTWACAIVYILGRVDFLDAKSSSPHMTTIDLCAAFGVGERTLHTRARVIADVLQTRRGRAEAFDAFPMLRGTQSHQSRSS